MLNIGDKIIVVAHTDDAVIGDIGTIINTDSYHNSYGVVFDTERMGVYHDGVVGKYPGREYWVSRDCVVLFSGMNMKTVKCKKCGKVTHIFCAKKSKNGDYYCPDCYCVKDYYTRNNEQIHKPTKAGKTYGFEFESVKKSDEEYLNMLHEKYHLIPTHDGSLPVNGVEFKTPTYMSLVGVESLFKQFDKWVDFSDYRCGQHINIGDVNYIDSTSIKRIRVYAPYIFGDLVEYMRSHTVSTIRICGRNFTSYASDCASYSDHCSWINLSHDNRIEFRLSKFVNPRQYMILTKMWTEMLDCVINNFVKKYNCCSNSRNMNLSKNTSDKLVKIFKRYEDLTK